MIKRALSTLAAAVLATSALAVHPTPVAAASYGTCVSDYLHRFFSYTEKSSVSKNVRNVRATIQVSSPISQFRPCSWSQFGDSSSGWVAIVPGSGNPQEGNGNAILQIGLIACDSVGFSVCDNSTLHYFWAEGGCQASLPDPQDLGVTNTSSHIYQIRHYTDHIYDLRIDSVSKLSFSDTSHTDINCWINYNYDKGQWAFERVDRGDGLGDSSHKAAMNPTYMMWYDPGDTGTWASPAFDFCDGQPSDHPGVGSCSYGPNYLYGWTTY